MRHCLQVLAITMMVTLIVVVLAISLVFAPANAEAILLQDEAETLTDEETTPAASGSGSDSPSNLVPLLIGGVLVFGGAWGYLNKRERFPGTRFR